MGENEPHAIRTFDGSYLTMSEISEFGLRIEPEPSSNKKKVVIKVKKRTRKQPKPVFSQN